jgi:hypothetical protein
MKPNTRQRRKPERLVEQGIRGLQPLLVEGMRVHRVRPAESREGHALEVPMEDAVAGGTEKAT